MLRTPAVLPFLFAEPETVVVHGAPPPRSASEKVLERDVIAAAPHRTASDLLLVVPGVFVSQHSGEGKAHQIFFRGFDAQHGQDVEIWVGGIPVNEVSNVHGQGYADLHFVMPEVVKEVRSTPGTYDPRQGDFAVAGSMRMRLGYDEEGITAKETLGSFGARRHFVAFHPKASSDETFAAFEDYTTDGFGPNRAARRGSFIGQVGHTWESGIGVRALATTYASRFDSPGVVRVTDVAAGTIDRFGTYDPRQGGSSSRTQLLFELKKEGDDEGFSLAPFISYRTLALRQNFTGFLADTLRGGQDRLDSDNSQQVHEDVMVGATASYRHTLKVFSPRDGFEVGFLARNDWIEQSQRRLSEVNDQPTETLVDASVRGTNVGGYVDAAIHPIARIVVRGGVRADALSYRAEDNASASGAPSSQVRAAQGSHFGKKATIDAVIVPGLHALASYGEGFRSPQARSLAGGQKTPFTTVTSYEVGLRYADGRRFSSSVAAFHTRLSEDLAFDPVTTRNEAVPGTARTGASVDVTARPLEGFVMNGSLTYTRATFTGSDATYASGDLLPYVPQIVSRVDTSYSRTFAQVFERPLVGRLGWALQALARRPLPYSEIGTNVFLTDVSAGLRLKEVELGIDVYNLLDARWNDGEFVFASRFDRSQAASLVPARHFSAGSPRTFFASLAIHL